MLENGYDYLFNCYYDTYFVESRFLDNKFESYDYSGKYGSPSLNRHCQGGPGVFISSRLCRIVCEEMLTAVNGHPIYGICDISGGFLEDFWTGLLAKHHEELSFQDLTHSMVDLHRMDEAGPLKTNTIMTMHMSTLRDNGVEYEAKHMLQKHKEWKDSWS